MHADLSLSTLHVAGDAYVCCVGGELDERAADSVRVALDSIHARGARRIIVDLCAVRFLDATSLGLLLLTAEQLRAEGGELVVVADDPRILRVFEPARLTEPVRVERTLADAVGDVALRPRA